MWGSHYSHLSQGGIRTQEVSCTDGTNGCTVATLASAHALSMCFPSRRRQYRWLLTCGPPARIASTLTPHRHMGLSDSLFVCFKMKMKSISCAPFVLDFRLKKKDLPFKMPCLHCVSALRESTKPPHSGWIINLD